ncbi:MAG: hypothetical protein EOL93_00960 [Epsilonproteobacteria bacterium]|nr:hypothetical protein [Campylobacterota bacterium]
MKVTLHASERFLQRVMNKTSFSVQDILRTKEYLENLVGNLVVGSYRKHVVIPNHQRFFGVYQENTLITVIPKDKKYMAPMKRLKTKAFDLDY